MLDEENKAMIGYNKHSRNWYCWNGKDIAIVKRGGNLEAARSKALKLYRPDLEKPEGHVDDVKKEIRNEIKYINDQTRKNTGE